MTWKTTKEHWFDKDGPYGSKEAVCGQVSDSPQKIKCKSCEKVLESPAKKQLKLGEEKACKPD